MRNACNPQSILPTIGEKGAIDHKVNRHSMGKMLESILSSHRHVDHSNQNYFIYPKEEFV